MTRPGTIARSRAAAVLALLISLCGVARGQDFLHDRDLLAMPELGREPAHEPDPRWQRHYEAAMDQFAAGRLLPSVAEFEAAYRDRPLPRFLVNIGQVYRKLGQPAEALRYFEQYLRAERAVPDPEMRAKVEAFMALARAELQAQRAAAARPRVLPAAAQPAPAPTDGAPGRTPLYRNKGLWIAVAAAAAVVVGVAVPKGLSDGGQSSVSKIGTSTDGAANLFEPGRTAAGVTVLSF
jgi:tetratricopeptide (TPR) repeat protein